MIKQIGNYIQIESSLFYNNSAINGSGSVLH
jgi:hypothetical protein